MLGRFSFPPFVCSEVLQWFPNGVSAAMEVEHDDVVVLERLVRIGGNFICPPSLSINSPRSIDGRRRGRIYKLIVLEEEDFEKKRFQGGDIICRMRREGGQQAIQAEQQRVKTIESTYLCKFDGRRIDMVPVERRHPEGFRSYLHVSRRTSNLSGLYIGEAVLLENIQSSALADRPLRLRESFLGAHVPPFFLMGLCFRCGNAIAAGIPKGGRDVRGLDRIVDRFEIRRKGSSAQNRIGGVTEGEAFPPCIYLRLWSLRDYWATSDRASKSTTSPGTKWHW